jgi:hypothetical protein
MSCDRVDRSTMPPKPRPPQRGQKGSGYRAGDPSMLEAYDKLVDRGSSAWLEEVRSNLKRNGGEPKGLVHLMLGFDDGPTYEVVCRSFRIDEK